MGALITAWECLFEICRVSFNPHSVPNPKQHKRLLVLPGAGGTGSFAIQLGKLAGLFVVATASRPESMQACRDLGADVVINHREPLKPQLEAAGLPGSNCIDYIFNGFDISNNFEEYLGLLAPLGTIADVAPSGFAITPVPSLMGAECRSPRSQLCHGAQSRYGRCTGCRRQAPPSESW